MILNIVIPMAGAGSRFSQAGYVLPKPLIPIHHMPMIQLVIHNLRPRCPHRFIFVCQRAHVIQYGLNEKLQSWAPGSVLVEVDGLTDGALCTVLAAKQWINDAAPLMIANSDQYIDFDINAYLDSLLNQPLDGLIMTMRAHDPKWSFIASDHQGHVTRVVEKEVISQEATVGIYNFKRGEDFVAAAEKMMQQNLRVNGEFYVAPVYNQLIELGQKIGSYNIGQEKAGMYGLGTPEDLIDFLNVDFSKQITEVFA